MLLCVFVLTPFLLRPALAGPLTQEGLPELTIEKTSTGDGTLSPGDTVSFSISVTNSGAITATNVVVQDDYDEAALPTIDILSDAEQDQTTGAQNDGSVITWQLGDLAPGEEWSAVYAATAAETFASGVAEVRNNAYVSAEGVHVAQADPVVLSVQAPQLTLTLERERVDGDGRIFPGDTVRYVLSYSNNGTDAADNVSLQASLNETVVEDILNVTAGGLQTNSSVRWDLGTVERGASGEVSFEVTLESVLLLDTEVNCSVILAASSAESVTTSDSFTPPPPLVVERVREDLNGGAIEPGDTLRFTIRFENIGFVSASDVVVQDDYADAVAAGVSDISSGGRELEGAIEWVLTNPLEPGAEQTVSYKVRLRSGIDESTDASNTAIIYIGGVEVDRAQTTMTIELPQEEDALSQLGIGIPVFQEETTVALLVGVSLVAALLTVGGMAGILLRQKQWKEGYLRFFIEGVIVIVLAETVLVLAMNNTIESDGAVSILSSIVGYVFGRGVTQLGSGGQGSTRPSSPGSASEGSSDDRPGHDLER
jgi:hypothetical protein